MFPFFPVELVRLSTLPHQEFSLLFVHFGGRFAFLPLMSSDQRLEQIHPGNEWLEGRAHTEAAFSKGWDVDHQCEKVTPSALHAPSDDLTGDVAVGADGS